MKLSVIITSYNYDKFLSRAIRSVLQQSLDKALYEVIVIDDASTDNTKLILEPFEDICRIFHLEKNVGIAEARNIGIKKARGQFVIFVDADDYIHYEMLKTQLLFLEENNSLDAVSIDYYTVNEKGDHLNHISADENPIACGIMFRKDHLIDIGMYDPAFKAREEEDLRARFQEKYKIYNIILPLYRYWKHENNLTNDISLMQEFREKLSKKLKKQKNNPNIIAIIQARVGSSR